MLKERNYLIAEMRQEIQMKTQALENMAAEGYHNDVQEKMGIAKTMGKLKKENGLLWAKVVGMVE